MAKSTTSKSSKKLDHTLIRDLAELLTETGLSEIEIEQPDIRIRVARNFTQEISAPALQSVAPAVAVQAGQSQPTGADTPHPGAVPSPMVGTVYLSADPESDPYIKVGQQVKEGDILMIVEAMKTMNHIASPRSGKITAILIENKQPVEFGEPLLIIE